MNYRRSNMKLGQIQLGVKKGSGKSLDRVSAQGFFYAGRRVGNAKRKRAGNVLLASLWETKMLVVLLQVGLNPASVAPNFNFYDIPSQKRLARCTNIPHTGALPTVKGVGQWLSWGFQSACKPRGLVKECKSMRKWLAALGSCVRTNRNLTPFESLFSAAKIRLLGRNTRLR